ncbi:MAG: TIGR01212 family radical SAM protein [Clostridia bacterium]|nr:TIGR01212 family radical SAM protein [Clostridia bacterium]
MKKTTQAQSNPFPYSDTNKRYHTYDYYLRNTFGGKCAKLPLDAGLTCPNIDGRCGRGGCIYCSDRGSGDFAPEAQLSIAEQIAQQKAAFAKKWDTTRCIAYFQAHTNTYAPLPILKNLFEAALDEEGIVGLNIATRADCLEDDTVAYLGELAERTILTVELGLQSSSDETARLINRGHTFAEFVEGYRKLRCASEKIQICVHLIFGLPGEDDARMLQSVRDVTALRPDQVKLHLLHVLRGTLLARLYKNGEYEPLEREHYVRLVADALELLPPETVIGRLTGDGAGDVLLAPEWSRKKTTVINDIDKLLFARNSWQGKRFLK